MFNLERTEVKVATIQGNLLMKFVDAMMSYGVGEFDIYNPPWPGGYDERTEDGVLFTRVERWMHTTYGIKLYSADKSDLSNLLSASIVHPGVSVEMNNDFQWNPGDYGDKKSCFWGGKRQAWPMIYRLGGAAIKLYRNGKGIARCLVLPYGEDPSKPVLFNAYGMALAHIANLYTVAIRNGDEAPSSMVWAGLSVDGKTNKPVHINDNGGFVIGVSSPKPTNLSAAKYYLKRYDKYHLFCERCYHRVSMESDNVGNVSKDYTHVVMCRECYGELRNSTEGFPPRYLPANVWYTKHRRIEETQPDDNAEPSPVFTLPSEWTGTAWTGTVTSPDVELRPGSVSTRNPAFPAAPRPFAVSSLNQTNTALMRVAGNMVASQSARAVVLSRARGYGLTISPTDREVLALFVLMNSPSIPSRVAGLAFRAVGDWPSSAIDNVISAWLSTIWDGSFDLLETVIPLRDVVTSRIQFNVKAMAEDLLVRCGFYRDDLATLNEEEMVDLFDTAARHGVTDAIRLYDTIMNERNRQEEGDEDDEG